MIFIPGERRRTSNSKIKKNIRDTPEKYLYMAIIENLLIFLINTYAFQIQTGILKYLHELNDSLLKQLFNLTRFSLNKSFRI